MQEPTITPELVQKHNLTPDEYAEILEYAVALKSANMEWVT